MLRLWLLAHFLSSLMFAFFLVYLQSYVLSGTASGWWHWDLLAIYVFYVGLEHHTLNAATKICLASLLFEMVSSVPSGFAVTAHLVMMVVGNRLAFWLEMQQRGMQLLLFAVLLVVKEVMLAATISAIEMPLDLGNFMASRLPGLAVTVLLALPIMELLAWIDGTFEQREAIARHVSRQSL